MGVECPICGKHAAYISAVTPTGQPAKKPDDVIGYNLACGHYIGNDEYMKYRQDLDKLDAEEARAIKAVKERTKSRKTALWSAIIEPKKED